MSAGAFAPRMAYTSYRVAPSGVFHEKSMAPDAMLSSSGAMRIGRWCSAHCGGGEYVNCECSDSAGMQRLIFATTNQSKSPEGTEWTSEVVAAFVLPMSVGVPFATASQTS